MGKNLVLVGGGHAHLTCLKKLKHIIDRGHRATLISPSTYHYYSGMGPGMLAGTYQPQEIRFNVKKMAEAAGGAFICGTLAQVDYRGQLLHLTSGQKIDFDVVSFNIGSSVPVAPVTIKCEENKVFAAKPIDNLLRARPEILNLMKSGKPRLLVVGGGPAGLEIAGNSWRLIHDQRGEAQITLLAGRRLLSSFPDKVRRLALKSLESRGIEVWEGPYLSRLEPGRAILDDGRELPCDLSFLALGVKPSPLFADSGLPTGPDGGLLVNNFLQSFASPGIFGGGDCINFQSAPLDKVGVYAVRQSPILYYNLLAALEGWQELKPFHPGGSYLLIFNLGNGRGIFCRKNWVWDGRKAFHLKNYIDRNFMKKFQISGERREK
jgi:NADH dehydrogenase FAD-containing subunit